MRFTSGLTKNSDRSQLVKPTKLKRFVATASLSMFLTHAATANVVGSDTQNFNPTPSGLDYFTVRSSKVLKPGTFSLGLFLDGATNTLPYIDDPAYDNSDAHNASRTKINDTVVGADAHVAYGVIENLEIGLNLPQSIHQKVKSENYHGQYANVGNTDIRLSGKYRFLGDDSYGLAAVTTISLNRMKENPYTGEKNKALYSLELVADKQIDKLSIAGNLGYRWRGGEDIQAAPVDVFGNQLIMSTAVGYKLESIHSEAIAEIYGSSFTGDADKFADRKPSAAELLLGMKYFQNEELTWNYGIGTELQHGIATADMRLFAGVTWTMGQKQVAVTKIVATPKAPARKPDETVVVRDILFDFDSANMARKGSTQALDDIGRKLVNNPNIKKIIVEGHTCTMGSEQYNTTLSQKRAETIKSWLIEKYKINPSRIDAQGLGQSHPVATNKTAHGRELNRRVEFKIFK